LIDIEKVRRDEFPITRSGIYLDHATLGPLPNRHIRAVDELMGLMSTQGLRDLFQVSADGVDQVRNKAAALLRCDPKHICFVRNTGQGVGLVAQGLDWRAGDEVVVYELDHPACIYPWLNLSDRGVKTRFVKDRGRFGFDPGDVLDLLGPRTRAVCLSLVNFGHGARCAVEQIGAFCRDRDIWFVVDAVQAVGVLHVDASIIGADIVVAHGYKFLLSGFGIGVCYCSDRALAELKVHEVGWNSVKNPFDIDSILAFDLDLATGARHFEPSFQPLPQVFGMGATLDLLNEAGAEAIEGRVLALTRRIVAGLLEKGYQVVGPQAIEAQSAIISIALRSDAEKQRMENGLAQCHAACSVRESRVRLSPHFYNTDEEVDRLVSCL
jgi:selenocysteine lyase/cysteine desulfurase